MDEITNESTGQGDVVATVTTRDIAEMYAGHADGKNDIAIDSMGRIQTLRRDGVEEGVSLRKRRAWYN